MAQITDRIIIRQCLDHPGLLSASELAFVRDIAQMPARRRMTQRQLDWLYEIGRHKLDLPYQAPRAEPVVDLRSRAYPDDTRRAANGR